MPYVTTDIMGVTQVVSVIIVGISVFQLKLNCLLLFDLQEGGVVIIIIIAMLLL